MISAVASNSVGNLMESRLPYLLYCEVRNKFAGKGDLLDLATFLNSICSQRPGNLEMASANSLDRPVKFERDMAQTMLVHQTASQVCCLGRVHLRSPRRW